MNPPIFTVEMHTRSTEKPKPQTDLLIIAVLLLTGNLGKSLPAQTPTAPTEPSAPETVFVDGLVKQKKKYSFVLQGFDRDHTVRVGPTTVIAARLIRPTFDWTANQVSVEIPASAPDGRKRNNLRSTFNLPPQIFFYCRYGDEKSLQAALQKKPVPVPAMVMTPAPVEPVDEERNRTLAGKLEYDGQSGKYFAVVDGNRLPIAPNLNATALEGFNIFDLKIATTEIFLNARREGEQLFAKRIEFIHTRPMKEIFDQALPKCLILGDTVSLNYLPALIKELEGSAVVHHPAANCQGSANFRKLHRWLGLYRDPQYRWDLIAFNFGLADANLSRDQYQANLREVIRILRKTQARLVWIDSTPVPFGYNDPDLKPGETIPADKRFDYEFEEADPVGLLPGRMKLQNRWAHEVLKSHPEIRISSVWETVHHDRSRVFSNWWYGKSTGFKYKQSVPVARTIAQSIKESLTDR